MILFLERLALILAFTVMLTVTIAIGLFIIFSFFHLMLKGVLQLEWIKPWVEFAVSWWIAWRAWIAVSMIMFIISLFVTDDLMR